MQHPLHPAFWSSMFKNIHALSWQFLFNLKTKKNPKNKNTHKQYSIVTTGVFLFV